MKGAGGTPHLYETEWIDWTPEKLERRIAETEHLLRRLEKISDDPDVHWIRPLLKEDLSRKREVLAHLRSTAAEPERSEGPAPAGAEPLEGLC